MIFFLFFVELNCHFVFLNCLKTESIPMISQFLNTCHDNDHSFLHMHHYTYDHSFSFSYCVKKFLYCVIKAQTTAP